MAVTRDDVQAVRDLRFANLTQPILEQMRESRWSWRSLVSIGRYAAKKEGQGAEWGPDAAAGSLQIKLSKHHEARIALLFWSDVKICGPDTLRNKVLGISAPAVAMLPDTLRIACAGRKVSEVIETTRFHGTMADVEIRRAQLREWGIELHLDLKYIQPTESDIARMIELHEQDAITQQ